MHQLFPFPCDPVDPTALYADLPPAGTRPAAHHDRQHRRRDRVAGVSGLLDELCLTLSPLLIGGTAKRILAGPGLVARSGWRLHSLCEQDGFLFLRYRPQ